MKKIHNGFKNIEKRKLFLFKIPIIIQLKQHKNKNINYNVTVKSIDSFQV